MTTKLRCPQCATALELKCSSPSKMPEFDVIAHGPAGAKKTVFLHHILMSSTLQATWNMEKTGEHRIRVSRIGK